MAREVSSYYDFRTRFARTVHSREQLSFHRGLYVNGGEEDLEALTASYDLVLGRAKELCESSEKPPAEFEICDFGSGTGSGLIFLGRHLKHARLVGVTNSAVQHRIAEETLLDPQFVDIRMRCQMICGDYTKIAFHKKFHLIYSIESFIYSPDPEAFLESASRHLEPGGKLIIIDSFLAKKPLVPRLIKKLDDYRSLHFADSLTFYDDMRELSASYHLKFEHGRDLTPFLKLRRPLDQVRRVLAPLVRIMASSNNLLADIVGLEALESLLSSGAIRYKILSFRKNDEL